MKTSMDRDDMMLDLCERLGVLGLTREACRIYTVLPYEAADIATDVMWANDGPKVKAVAKALRTLIVGGHDLAAEEYLLAMTA